MARILSVWCPNWPITTWRRRNPGLKPAEATGPLRAGALLPRRGKMISSSPSGGGGCAASGGGQSPPPPFALLVSELGTRRLAAVDETALARGLSPGQKAADALALCPDLVTAEHDPQADHVALEALSDWCVRFSPAVALDGDDGLFLDITGTDHLWGGEAMMLADLLARLARWGVPARAAIADTPGAAWALARFGARFSEPGQIAPPHGQRALLADLPVAALRLDETATAQLPRLGLFRIGQILGLPRAQLAKRFGLHLTQRLDQALGAAGEALVFRRP
ncbi:MAG: DNA polymerase Y family protein, partial [Alphaproteobacteria bacterium]|nr:DNA polymerase Y family protein [Alphaproteobacteria bacterium]